MGLPFSIPLVTKEEIAEVILATRFALASTTFVTAIEGMEYLVSETS